MASRLLLWGSVAAVLTYGIVSVAFATGPGGWDHLGTGTGGADALNGKVNAFHQGAGRLYIGGEFTDAGGVADADRIASWNGSAWEAVSSPASAIDNGGVYAIASANGKLYAGGTFLDAGGNAAADFLAVWDGSAWGPFCNGTGIHGNVKALQIVGNTLYVGGEFQDGAGLAEADYLLACDLTNGNASPTTADPAHPFSGPVHALAADANGTLYAGGRFLNLENIAAADNIAYRDGGGWHALSSSAGACSCALDGFVRALAVSGTDVYIGTDVINVDGIVKADHVVKWNGSAYSALGANTAGNDGWFPTTAYIYAMATYDSLVIAGGSWQDANGDARADSIAYLDGGAWRPAGSDGAGNGPLNNVVNALAVFDLGQAAQSRSLYAGGNFTVAGGDAQASYAASLRLTQIIAFPTPTPTASPPPQATPTVTPGPAPQPTPTVTPAPDVAPPKLTAMTLSRTEFRAAPSGAAISAAAIGTRVTFTLNEPGSVRFTVERPLTGRRVAGKCVRPRPANRRRSACVRWVAVKGSAVATVVKGVNHVTFRGRMGGRTLKLGSYRLSARAKDRAANAALPRRVAFRIVR